MARPNNTPEQRAALVARNTTHGKCKSRAYTSWRGMIERCSNPNNNHYKNYGGAGVTVCDEWKRFENFYASMGDRPDGMTLDRINPHGNYEPSNCRWADEKTQTENKRDRRVVTFKGVTKHFREWEKELGFGVNTLYWRVFVKKMPIETAFTLPLKPHGYRK